jgi:hypothetical protein
MQELNVIVIKKAFHILVGAILSVFCLVLLTYLLLCLPPVQQKIKDFALQEVMKKTQGKLSIENFQFRPFNHLLLENVYVADLKGDTLLSVENLKAGFNLFKLLDNQLLIHSVELTHFAAHLSKDSVDSPFNFQFLIDTFASDTTQSSDNKKLQIEIDDIVLKNGLLTYDILSEPMLEPGLLDVSHVDIRDFQADISLKSIDLQKLDVAVSELSFREKSGFTLTQLELKLKSDKERIYLDNFILTLPRSELSVTEANLDYSGKKGADILTGADYSIAFSSNKLNPADFSCFSPQLTEFTENLTFSGEANGRLPQIVLPRFQVDYGKHLHLKADAQLADFNRWETAPFELNLERFYIDETGIEQIFIDKSETKTTGLPAGLDSVSLTGKLSGSLPDLTLQLNAQSGQGDLSLQGTGGYIFDSGAANFEFDLESSDFNVRNLVADTLWGNASFHLFAKGNRNDWGKIETQATADILQLDYRGYTYQNINADAYYVGDSVEIKVNSEDANLPLQLQASAYLEKKNPSLQLQAVLNNIQLDSLHFLPKYPGSELSGEIAVDIKGFDPEQMSASLTIDRLHLATHSGAYNDSPIVISYDAGADHRKQLNIRSRVLNVRGKGQFTYDGISRSVKNAFPDLFPAEKNKIPQVQTLPEEFNFFIAIRQANTITKLLGMGETQIPDSALFVGKYNNSDSILNLNTTAFCIFSQTDTARLDLELSNIQNNLAIHLTVDNNSPQYDLEGNLGAEIAFIPHSENRIPDMNIALEPGSMTLNGTAFQIYPAEIAIAGKRYEISNFALRHSSSEYLKVNGIISDEKSDSVVVNINRFEIETILSALKNKIPLSGMASGDISLSQLTTSPFVLTRNFSVDQLAFDQNPIGDLKLTSGWNSERKGLVFRATLNNPDQTESIVSGIVLPEKDSLSLTGNIQGLKLKWFTGSLSDDFYGIAGELGANIKVNGKISAPALSGTAYLKDASIGVKKLNTLYRISDSIHIEPDKFVFNNLIVYDETKKNGKINGTISHKQFSSLNPNLTLDFNNFLVLNNAQQTDSLFYGLLRMNGSLNVVSQNKNWLIQGNLSNGKTNRVMVNMPEEAAEAQHYSWITYLNTEEEPDKSAKEQKTETDNAFSLPLKLHIVFSVDPNLNVGVVFNPDTHDAAQVTGNGLLDFSYDLNNSNMNLQGNYVIDQGKCTLTLKNITKKTFLVQQGGRLNFRGDPLNTTFDLTAIYNLRTDLTTLDPGFANLTASTKTPVNCLLTASGNMKNMQLKYNVELPNESDEIKRKLNSLLYTDDIKIKEIAYLLAIGSFLPINSSSNRSNTVWTSLASSSITSQLNNLLSGVLNDNWTIGTDLHTNDANFAEMDMDVNVSTQLFDNRLTVNSTFGYHNNLTQSDNFTGDFDFEYKLSPNGNVVLQFYNLTNNQYYDKAKTTQGLGIVYKRTGRTLRQLFRSFSSKKK